MHVQQQALVAEHQVIKFDLSGFQVTLPWTVDLKLGGSL